MTVLISEKRENFVLNTYREQILNTRKSIFKIKHLAKTLGPFSYLEKKDKFIKVILSQDPGYLLAETVLEYLKIDNQPWVIYLEESPENKAMVMLVVNEGEVVKDILIPITHVEDCLTEIAQDNNPYQFHIVDLGSVNIDIVSIVQKKFCKKNSECKIKKYTESVLDQIICKKKYKLLSLDEEIKIKKIKNPNYLGISVFSLVIFLSCLGYYHHQKITSEEERLLSEHQRNRALREAFILPSPKKIVKSIQERLIKVQYMSGWPVTHATYSPGKVLLIIESNPLRNEYLKKWAEKEAIPYDEKANQLSFSLMEVEKNSTPKHIRKISTTEEELTSALKKIVHSDLLKKQNAQDKGVYNSIDFNIDIKNQSIVFLELISDIVAKFPAVITNINLKIENAAINGSVTIELRGI